MQDLLSPTSSSKSKAVGLDLSRFAPGQSATPAESTSGQAPAAAGMQPSAIVMPPPPPRPPAKRPAEAGLGEQEATGSATARGATEQAHAASLSHAPAQAAHASTAASMAAATNGGPHAHAAATAPSVAEPASAPASTSAATATAAPSAVHQAEPSTATATEAAAGPSSEASNLDLAASVAHHALITYQAREMVAAILRLDILDLASIADEVAERAAERLDQEPRPPGQLADTLDITHVAAIKGVLKIVGEQPFFEHQADQTPSGVRAYLKLRQAVFAGVEYSEDSLILPGSMSKVHTFHECCLWLLVSCLRPSNCLRLMRLGQALSLCELEEEAFLYSLVNLRQVLEGPGMHEWRQLDSDQVIALLSNSNLKLSSELQIWEALSTWLSHDEARKPLLTRMLGACLNLEKMDVLELQQLRQTQLVASCAEAASLVSAAYTKRIMSSVHLSRTEGDGEGASGLPSSTAPSLPSTWGVGSNTISPDEEHLLKRTRLDQQGIAAAVVGTDVVRMVDAGTATHPSDLVRTHTA